MNRKGNVWGWIILVVLILLVIVLVTPVLRDWLLPWTAYKAEVGSAEKIIEKTYNADNAIYNYEWFKKQEEKIKSTEQQILNTKQQMDDYRVIYGANASAWDSDVKAEYSRLSSTYTGQKNFYAEVVAEYNARSKMANREVFHDGLPRNIDTRIFS